MTNKHTKLEITPFKFGTKAETLERLSGHVRSGKLCDQIIIASDTWKKSREALLSSIIQKFEPQTLIIRSSAANEDSWSGSLAGAHLSVADVELTPTDIAKAIDSVFESYREHSKFDQVLVQPMVRDVAISGVVLTRDLDTGSPYYVVNYDDYSGRTDAVTGGRESKTILIRRAAPDSIKSPRISKLIACVMELESITVTHELDIEFCITNENELFIFQVRPLSARGKWLALADTDIDDAVYSIRQQLIGHMKPSSPLAGNTTIFTEMTDWNPAEMIGNTPRPLALSLYKTLITDRIWAEARQAMGYRLVDGPLLIDFHGRPFIDVRKSFNSFLPAGIQDATAEKLVNHQLYQLAKNKELHDKVEFEICVTCWDFSEAKAMQRFIEAGLSADECRELRDSLKALTNGILVAGADGLSPLLEQASSLLEGPLESNDISPLQTIKPLITKCCRMGTLTFSQLARHGFIGMQFLKSLVEQEALSKSEMETFMNSISTVATTLINDFHTVSSGLMPRDQFLIRYGHLRPGTYDILSWRYDEKPDLYLSHTNKQTSNFDHQPFELSPKARTCINALLEDVGYDISADHLFEYIAAAIKGREEAKFAFTRTISNVLSILSVWGSTVGLTRDDISFLPIEILTDDFKRDDIKAYIQKARDNSNITRAIRLPHLIQSTDNVDVVGLPLGQPTFITSKAVTAKTRLLGIELTPDIDDHIVMIESADPGFDWIFSHNILGLITKYGGANSHMAIRCAEFGLPAAIGCGERLFDILSKAPVVELNAAAKKLGSH